MRALFPLLFIGLPLVELYLLLTIGEVIGGWSTIALVLVTGIVGVSLAKAEGLRLLAEVREQLAQGQLPEESLVSGLLLVIGGAFLLTPGVLTDAFGLAMLIAPVRRALAGRLRHRFAGKISSHVGTVGLPGGTPHGTPHGATGGFGASMNFGFPSNAHSRADDDVIDVEVVVDPSDGTTQASTTQARPRSGQPVLDA